MYITRPNVALCVYYLSFTVYDVSARGIGMPLLYG